MAFPLSALTIAHRSFRRKKNFAAACNLPPIEKQYNVIA